MQRCSWAKDGLMRKYHDEEWGLPVHDDKRLFEMLCLEGAQAGLSWSTILNKRESYRDAFENFDYLKVSKYSNKDIKRLLGNQGIVRNKLKIASAIINARQFILVQKEFGSFDRYVWGFVKNRPKINKWRKISDLPYSTKVSEEMSKDLKKRGFSFVGPSVCYSFMQAVGMVNDHLVGCFRNPR